ncbi:hypothetical protein ACFQ08_40645 [Streptosporangium algeriense]|uniref:Secreted protein n=1 Tax=Streptosporangium algeriense TaxID=1682748 RepID=A0ABW3E462_9ACTN
MMARTRIVVAAAIAALAFTGTGMAAGSASAASTASTSSVSAAACAVQHGPWYTKNDWNKVDVYNECSGGKYVCVDIPTWGDYGPVYVAGRTAKTITYGWAWSVPTGRGIYYAESSSSC